MTFIRHGLGTLIARLNPCATVATVDQNERNGGPRFSCDGLRKLDLLVTVVLCFVLSGLLLASFLMTPPNALSRLTLDAINYFVACLLPAAALVLMQEMLNAKTPSPRLGVFFRGYALMCGISLLCLPFSLFHFIAPLMQGGVALSVVVFAFFSWRAHRAGQRGALYFSVGSVALMFAVMLSGLAPSGENVGLTINTGSILALLVCGLLIHLGLLLDVESINGVPQSSAVAVETLGQTLAEQEKKLRSEQMRLFSFVAHELRNPLGFIIYGLGNLRIDLADQSDAVQQRVGRIAKAARRMSELIDQSLRLQRLNSPDFLPDFDAVSPAFPAIEACSSIGESRPDRMITFISADDLPAEVMLDVDLVTLALVSLLDHAIKYSLPSVPISLTVDCDLECHDQIVYRVVVQGAGISEADQALLFRSDTDGHSEGLADFDIGLSLVMNIVRHHGGSSGRISCQATGAVFEIRLPVAQVQHIQKP